MPPAVCANTASPDAGRLPPNEATTSLRPSPVTSPTPMPWVSSPPGTEYGGRRGEPAAGELGEHLDVGHEALAGHHDDVVAAVAADVGDLEVVPAVVRHGDRRRRDERRRPGSRTRSPCRSPTRSRPRRGAASPSRLPSRTRRLSMRRGEGRGAERAVGELREHLDADVARRPTTTSVRPSPVTSPRASEPGRSGYVPAVAYRTGAPSVPPATCGRHDELEVDGRVGAVAGRRDDVGEAVAGHVADRDRVGLRTGSRRWCTGSKVPPAAWVAGTSGQARRGARGRRVAAIPGVRRLRAVRRPSSDALPV